VHEEERRDQRAQLRASIRPLASATSAEEPFGRVLQESRDLLELKK
jgi:hypothetical protein